ncbi:MAG: hypothetical protein CL550_06450 [Alcanivorax sp.]|uniref:hypothetical protein n=1 Tax=Alcanivorax sp. TaxID=1872427 RepID=UPI000C45B7E7|nr:hypothetical protein [Alcanivorax sp.]MBB10569.1 hypothetical protein [Alcanivorax sp.]MBU84022.1 hypothetical protein [Alcanivorax sp.]|tara:strand:+ start:610 stop:897 length:288 start_codon:yes stop_codon:yes gene_type:complete
MDAICTIGLADSVKSLISKDSYYSLGKVLGVNPETARAWYTRNTVMDDAVGVRAAAMLNLDPEQVVLWLQVERMEKKGNDNLSQLWRHIAERQAA